MISLKDISLYFPGTRSMVLRDISWNIAAKEAWVLFGRNGSGKTKLLEIVTGYTSPSAGSIHRFDSMSIGCDIREIRKRIGIVNSLIKEMMPRNENVIDVVVSGFFASTGLYDFVDASLTQKAALLLDEISMDTKAYLPFRVLSDGEKQKVLMLRALINDPEILILDEPCMGLDLASREDLLETVDSLISKRGIAVIHVTHHIEEITSLFKYIFILDNGSCFYCGPLDKGLSSENMSRIFNRSVDVEKRNNRYFYIL
ncbi:MAG TPA: ATP-binding cassette domain-containing protein [Spirochaetota bacterium]|nr:ATP-binding cassette domain-containing protein [Spirochaetota bacterium]HPI88382.1 ATP-binding cassette domain-containing protein [Spirochaetota bacterium]HPR46760.1 ATP-binding cassette domain-containing protein [Spirochaetota bacterium]